VASPENRRVALMAIHPHYAKAILRGDKRVEFRRTRLARDVTHVVVYATTPVKAVVGMFEVEGVDEDSPAKLWSRYRRIGGIGAAAFDRYFAGASRGIAVRVGRVVTFPAPLAVSAVGATASPPQSFRYLTDESVAGLVATARG